ncbi:hypothetical protein U9472_23610 [Escherichia coli]
MDWKTRLPGMWLRAEYASFLQWLIVDDIRGTVPFCSVTRLMCDVMRLHMLDCFISPEFE